jgi:hypothetical protein
VTTTTAVNTIPKYNWKTKHSILQFTIKKTKKNNNNIYNKIQLISRFIDVFFKLVIKNTFKCTK